MKQISVHLRGHHCPVMFQPALRFLQTLSIKEEKILETSKVGGHTGYTKPWPR
jgi:hypothetical protein